MAWLWLLVPLVILALTLALWRAVTTLGHERADLQAEIDGLGPLAEQARGVQGPGTARRATGREQGER